MLQLTHPVKVIIVISVVRVGLVSSVRVFLRGGSGLDRGHDEKEKKKEGVGKVGCRRNAWWFNFT
jgi:hypothetical protein